MYLSSMEIDAWNTFKIEHPYIVRKSKKNPWILEPTFHAEETACYRLEQQTKVHVIGSVPPQHLML